MTIWLDKLINCLELETVDVELLSDVDDVLSWFVPSNTDSSYIALEKMYGQQILNQRFEEFLDRLVVDDSAVGEMFPVSLSEAHAKKRYRQLIRVFHPDRGMKSVAWLNYRAEKINKAHQVYLDHISNFDAVASVDEGLVEVSVGEKRQDTSRAKFTYKPNVWRARLGSPKEFQRKALAVLIIVSLLLVLITFFDNTVSFDTAPESGSRVVADTSQNLKEKTENYTLNTKAQMILQEADLLIAESSVLIEGADDLSEVNNLASSFELVDDVSGVVQNEMADVISTEEQDYDDVGVEASGVCDGDVVQESRQIKQEKTVSIRLNVREGPSLECSVLLTLISGSHLTLLAQTEDAKWTQVVNRVTSIKGWVNTELLMFSPEPKKYNLDETQKQKTINQRASNKANLQAIAVRGSENLVTQVELKRVPEEAWVAPVYFKVVEKMKKYYEVGDDDGIASLYMSSGRENDIRGMDKIRKYYKKAFKRTVDRKFKYSIENFKQDSESTAIVNGKLQLSMSSKRSLGVTSISANYKVVMVKVGDEYKIAAFEWAAI